MGTRRKWSDEEVFQIVFEVLRGVKSATDVCREHNISQAQFYKWKDMFLSSAKAGLRDKRNPKNRDPLVEENRKLKQLVGEYAMVIDTQKKIFQGEL